MTEPEPRQPDGAEEAASAEMGEPTILDEAAGEEVAAVPDLDAREDSIPSERRAAGPPLLPPVEALDEGEGPLPEDESEPTDPVEER